MLWGAVLAWPAPASDQPAAVSGTSLLSQGNIKPLSQRYIRSSTEQNFKTSASVSLLPLTSHVHLVKLIKFFCTNFLVCFLALSQNVSSRP